MMAMTEVVLSAGNQRFSHAVEGVTYQFSLIWRGTGWILDIYEKNTGNLVIGGIPLVTGADLMEQHEWMDLGFSLLVICDIPGQDYPTEYDLGTTSHLYLVTE